ncbi:MAG: SDR family oxidoreductase [Armatimonadetes bacterium]|nr:SDR family oxidoreductase [Armatimonadota bacterium]
MTDPVFDVEGRVAVLTGACGLIGRTIAHALHERGARLVLADLPEKDTEGFARKLGGETLGYPCTVAELDQVKGMLSATLDRFGRVDVIINNHHFLAKGAWDTRAEIFPEDAWDNIIDVNLKGTFLMCREFGRTMLEQGKGTIINMASTYGIVSSNPALYEDNSLASPIAYSASKGGVIMLTKYLACYWGARGVRVNALSPHGVWNKHEPAFERRFSALSPLKRMMQPEEIVGAVLFLASDASSYVNGANLLVEGGWTAW